MFRPHRVVLFCAASALSLSLVGAACSSKVDREGTKKLILDELKKSDVSDSDAQCVAKLLDGYSDSDLKKLDSEFTKNENPVSELGQGFRDKTVECVKGTAATQMLDELKKSVTLTAEQETCAADFFKALTATELQELNDTTKANEFGAKMVAKCGITGA
jgi:hypothetical protein